MLPLVQSVEASNILKSLIVSLCIYMVMYLRSAKTADKRMLLFTNEDNPFESIKGAVKSDMTKTTLQRAKVLIFFP